MSVAQTPPVTRITPELIAAAGKEGRLSWYTSVDLKVSEPVILREFIEDTIRRFSAVLADLPGIDLETHVNQNGDENSTGRRTGNIVYNTMCELLEGGTCATPLPVDPNPHTSTLPRAP